MGERLVEERLARALAYLGPHRMSPMEREAHRAIQAEVRRARASEDALVVALEECVDWMRRNPPSDGWGLLDLTQDTYRDRALEAAAAAIAKAKGEAND